MGPRVNAVNVSSARGDEENSRAPSREEEDSEEEESDEEEGEDRRVSLNSNSKSSCHSFPQSMLIFAS
jgi:hypothetical protein